MDRSPDDSSDEGHASGAEAESTDSSPEAFFEAGHGLSAVARAAMGTPSMAETFREVTGLGSALDALRVTGVLGNTQITSGLAGISSALAGLPTGMDVAGLTGALDVAGHSTALAGLSTTARDVIATGLGHNFTSGIETASYMPVLRDTLRTIADYSTGIDTTGLAGISTALDSARFTFGNIDYGGYDAAAAASAAANIGGVLDGVRLTVASSGAADVLRLFSVTSDVVSPLAEVARTAGHLDFGRLFHDLQLPDPARFDPPNWPTDLDISIVTEILNEDGIPLVWVPRLEIVKLLVEAPDRSSRIAILLDRVDDLIEDCRQVLAGIDDPTLLEQLPLVIEAVDAFASGHQRPAHALAVVVTETVVKRAVAGGYKAVAKKVLFDPEAVPWHRLRLTASLAPIGPFFTDWFPSWGTPPPDALSRHVSVHQAATSHYSPANAVVAMLLATSVLRGVQELQGGPFADADAA